MNDNFAKTIKKLRKAKKLTQSQLGEHFNITKTGVSYWESGKTMPSIDMVKKLADFFDVPTDYLIKGMVNDIDSQQVNSYVELENAKPSNIIEIPLYSSISCGTGLFVDDNIDDYIAVPNKFVKPNKKYFANYASGDSMVGKGIQNGDVLIFEQTQVLESGQIGSFCINEGDAVCKTFRKLSNGIVLLESANSAYDPIEIDVMKNECFRVIGKLVGSFKQF